MCYHGYMYNIVLMNSQIIVPFQATPISFIVLQIFQCMFWGKTIFSNNFPASSEKKCIYSVGVVDSR
jgi:hypothetical protein